MWLIIDDIRDLGCSVVARDPLAAGVVLERMGKYFEGVCFDHDLGSIDATGYDVLKYGLENDFLPARIQLVTMNPVGKTNMAALLKEHGYTTDDGVNFRKG